MWGLGGQRCTICEHSEDKVVQYVRIVGQSGTICEDCRTKWYNMWGLGGQRCTICEDCRMVYILCTV